LIECPLFLDLCPRLFDRLQAVFDFICTLLLGVE
jgi:hypothetical protein